MALYSARNIPLYVATVIPILVVETSGILCEWKDSALVNKFLDFQGKITLTEDELRGGIMGWSRTDFGYGFIYRWV